MRELGGTDDTAINHAYPVASQTTDLADSHDWQCLGGRCSSSRLPAAVCAADARSSTPERARLHRPRRPLAPLFGVDHTSHPAIVLSRASLGAQGGLDFLSVPEGAAGDDPC